MRISSAVTVESPAATAALAPLVPHRVVPRLVLSSTIALFTDPPRPTPGPDAAVATFAAIGLSDPTTLSTLPTGDAPAGLLRVTVRPPTVAAAARAPDCPSHVAEWVAVSAAEARRQGVVPAESAAEDDASSVHRFASRVEAGKVVGDGLCRALWFRGVRCGAVGCLVIAGIDDKEAALCTTVLVRHFRPAWVCFSGDAEALHRDSFLACNGNSDVFDFSRMGKLKHLPIAQGGFCVQDELRRIVLPRLSAAPLKKNSLFSMHDFQGLHVPWNWRATSLGQSTLCFGKSLVHVDMSYQASLTAVGTCTFQSSALVTACFRGCGNLTILGDAAFTGCTRLRILDMAECPKLAVDTIATNALGGCDSLELIIAPPHIDAAETSHRLETECDIKNVKVVHWPPSDTECGDGADEAVVPEARRVHDALDVAQDLTASLNTAERLPPLGVVPALPANYTADSADPTLHDADAENGRELTEVFEETPAARPARRSCPCCAVLVERYRRMQCAVLGDQRASVQPLVFGGRPNRDDDIAGISTPFEKEHLLWSRSSESQVTAGSDSSGLEVYESTEESSSSSAEESDEAHSDDSADTADLEMMKDLDI